MTIRPPFAVRHIGVYVICTPMYFSVDICTMSFDKLSHQPCNNGHYYIGFKGVMYDKNEVTDDWTALNGTFRL